MPAPTAGSQANTRQALRVPEASAVGHPGWTGSAEKRPVLWGHGGEALYEAGGGGCSNLLLRAQASKPLSITGGVAGTPGPDTSACNMHYLWCWEHSLTFLNLSFFVCKMGICVLQRVTGGLAVIMKSPRLFLSCRL